MRDHAIMYTSISIYVFSHLYFPIYLFVLISHNLHGGKIL